MPQTQVVSILLSAVAPWVLGPLPDAVIGQAYSQQIVLVSGGVAPHSFAWHGTPPVG